MLHAKFGLVMVVLLGCSTNIMRMVYVNYM